MRCYTAFLKKELMEGIRTYKLPIMLGVFLIFGIMNPLFAKLTPDLIDAVLGDMMTYTGEPTALDAWAQFFSNTTQMGMILTAILFSGVLSNELARGTLVNLLTKGLPRWAVILSKFTGMALIWTASVVVEFLVTWGYTSYLFPGGGTVNLLFAATAVWLFGIFLLAVIMLAAALAGTGYGTLLITGLVWVICLVVSLIPAAGNYNPLTLATNSMGWLTGASAPSAVLPAIILTAALSALFIALSTAAFRRKRL